jgi:hypothetical protein
MAKKEKTNKNHRANEAWLERKKELNQTLPYQNAQKMYRRACLKVRIAEGRITDKNREEMRRLGMVKVIGGLEVAGV